MKKKMFWIAVIFIISHIHIKKIPVPTVKQEPDGTKTYINFKKKLIIW
ncbi:hypothetical protein [Aerococcus vaginalis]